MISQTTDDKRLECDRMLYMEGRQAGLRRAAYLTREWFVGISLETLAKAFEKEANDA